MDKNMKCLVTLNDNQRKAVQKHALAALCEFDRLCKSHHINYSLGYGTLIGAIRHKGFIPWDDDIDVCVSREDLIKLRSFANNELKKGFFYQSHATETNWYRLYDKIRVDGTVFREIAHENENIHQGVYIDIFPIDNIPENKFMAKCQQILYKLTSSVLSAKYISPRYRHGANKAIAIIFKALFFPIRKNWLYRMAEKIACSTVKGKFTYNFESPYKDVFPVSVYEKYVDVPFEKYHFPAVACYDYWLRTIYGDYMKMPTECKRVSLHALSEFNIPD